jgi:adenylate kinase family enzyme
MLIETIICMGRSGSGKGTQIAFIQKYLEDKIGHIDCLHIETGHYFRSFIEENSVSAKLAKEVYLTGARQPDFLAVSMWGYVMCKDYTGTEHLIFDGTPRSLAESHIMEDALSFFQRFDSSRFKKPKVIYIDVSHDWAMDKMHKRARIDDKTEAQTELRMDWFEHDVMQAVDFFKTNDKFDFIHIEGEGSVEDVQKKILGYFV